MCPSFLSNNPAPTQDKKNLGKQFPFFRCPHSPTQHRLCERRVRLCPDLSGHAWAGRIRQERHTRASHSRSDHNEGKFATPRTPKLGTESLRERQSRSAWVFGNHHCKQACRTHNKAIALQFSIAIATPKCSDLRR